MANLGFGWMRLPLLSEKQTDIDLEQVKKMVDEYLAAGFNYFDTSFVYHGGASENAIKECLVKRYARDKFILTSKLPIFAITEEKQVEEIFNKQLENCGVEYFDYFLLHNMNIIRYEGVVKSCKMFDYLKKWKDAGKIKHIGFSFHDSAEVLDKILTEHPEVEAVQIVVNYIDWESYYIQSKKCYETIRKHGKKVLIMEPVKGGTLAKAPAEVEKIFKAAAPENSVASWAVRFAASLEDVIAVISGMSNLEQVKDNLATMKNFAPLTDSDKKIIAQANKIYRENGPLKKANFAEYENIKPKGISAAEVLETYNNSTIQPVPTFAAEANYFSVEKAKHKIKMDAPCFDEKIISNGEDITKIVKDAEKFLTDGMFFKYEV
ncbi:MAG: aldo/keto reductase [Selenomonadaceae bacterium]|nr:aldo/keto reductase [Selenomonadaceae bacterium]